MPSPEVPQVPQVVEGFLKDLLGARKAIKLYPPGNPLAAEWIQRLYRSFETAQKGGLPAVIRIANGRFEWEGGHLATRDAALDAFRFELESRRINEIAIEPGVEPWELKDLLDVINLRQEDLDAAGGWAALLAERNVAHIAVRGMFLGDPTGTESATAGLATATLDRADSLVAAILELLAQEFLKLADDRHRLSDWLRQLGGVDDDAEVVFAAIELLIPMIEREADRELRYRTLAESIVGLPDPLRSTLASTWLVPRAWIPDVLSLLTRFSGEELAGLTGLVPAEVLQQLRASLEEMPAADWRKSWLRDSLEETLASREPPSEPTEPLIADDDPAVMQLGTVARNACAPEAVLAYSVTVFFQLLTTPEAGAPYPVFVVDALDEAIADAMARDQLRLALRVLRTLNNTDRLRPEWIAEHQRRLHLLLRRLSARSYVSLLADVLRRSEQPERIRDAAEYLGMLGREATEAFVAIVVDSEEGGARARMLDVLGVIGPTAVPAIRPWVTDARWTVVRQLVALLSRFGDPSALQTIEKAAKHQHPQVRREVARALGTLGGKQALRPLLEYLHDPDAEVRLTTIKLLGNLMDASAVTPFREFLASPTRTVSDLLVKREIITALASIGSPEAREVLQAVAQRRVWPWKRNDQKVRVLAGEALQTIRQTPAERHEARE